MGPHYDQLAPSIQRFHRLSGQHELHGHVQTAAPESTLAQGLARLLGTPLQETAGPIHFTLNASPQIEVWTRHFPTHTMTSTLSLRGPQVEEHLGPARLRFDLAESGGSLTMTLQHLRFFGLPCPRWLMPRIVAQESGDGTTLHFHVEASLPLIGVVASYRGSLTVPLEVVL